jgi:hypothetical protein
MGKTTEIQAFFMRSLVLMKIVIANRIVDNKLYTLLKSVCSNESFIL